MARIFISYTAVNLNWAEWIAEVIEKCGHSAVLQDWDSPPGGDFVVWISEQIDNADVVLPIYSKAYFQSIWCTSEWTAALNKKKLVPIMIEKCSIPSVLSRRTYVKLMGKPEKACLEHVKNGLGFSKSGRTAESGFPGQDSASEADEIVKQWKRVARRAAFMGLVGASAVFVPGDAGDAYGSGGDTGWNDTSSWG